MPDRHNELELLALIEGELDAQATAALRKRLASDDSARELMEGIAVDRATLRSMPQPELPMDFLTAIEPMLARPMLMEPVANDAVTAARPGAYRREYRRRTRRVRWDRLAIAAVLMLALMAGLWAAVNGLGGRTNQSNEAVATNDGTGAETVSNPDQLAAVSDSSPLSSNDGAIHHYRPTPVAMDLNKPSMADAGGAAKRASDGRVSLIAATFALVVNTADASRTEQAVQVASSDLGEHSALVRNFSFEEAQKLAEEWRVANASSPESNNPRVASVGSGTKQEWKTPAEMKVLAERVRQRLKMLKPVQPEATSIEPSGQISGPRELAPTLEQQLDFSSRGASYTLAVPVAQINALIERLSLAEGQFTALQMLPEHQGLLEASAPKAADAWQPLMLWLTDGPKVRQEIERMSKEEPDAIVLVPIVMTQPHKR